MRYENDKAPGQNLHVNYEPSDLGGLKEAEQLGKDHKPYVEGELVRESIDRNDNTKQAGQTYREFEQWEKDEIDVKIGALMDGTIIAANFVPSRSPLFEWTADGGSDCTLLSHLDASGLSAGGSRSQLQPGPPGC